ncbi:MAG: GNAT family N-acetyltransferase [Massilia sp.]
MGFEIRPATPDDAPAACGVLRRSITECCTDDHQNRPEILDAWLGNKTPQTVAGWLSAPSNHTVVAEQDGEVVGVALVTQAGKLSLCYVLPEVLHRGVGKALLGAAEAQARAWGVSVLRLHGTASVRDFYARNGYVSAGRDKSCFGLECDLFWKKLNPDPAASPAQRKGFCNCSGQ